MLVTCLQCKSPIFVSSAMVASSEVSVACEKCAASLVVSPGGSLRMGTGAEPAGETATAAAGEDFAMLESQLSTEPAASPAPIVPDPAARVEDPGPLKIPDQATLLPEQPVVMEPPVQAPTPEPEVPVAVESAPAPAVEESPVLAPELAPAAAAEPAPAPVPQAVPQMAPEVATEPSPPPQATEAPQPLTPTFADVPAEGRGSAKFKVQSGHIDKVAQLASKTSVQLPSGNESPFGAEDKSSGTPSPAAGPIPLPQPSGGDLDMATGEYFVGEPGQVTAMPLLTPIDPPSAPESQTPEPAAAPASEESEPEEEPWEEDTPPRMNLGLVYGAGGFLAGALCIGLILWGSGGANEEPQSVDVAADAAAPEPHPKPKPAEIQAADSVEREDTDLAEPQPERRRRRRARDGRAGSRRFNRNAASQEPAPRAAPVPKTLGVAKAVEAPQEDMTPRRRAIRLYQQGNVLLSENKVTLAIQEFERAVDVDRTFGRPYRSLGVAYMKLGQQTKALAAYRKFVTLEPSHQDVPRIRAILDSP